MICITSISPNHANGDIQAKAVRTWLDNGFKVVSMNSHEEVMQLKNQYPEIEFVPTFRTLEKTYGRPLVAINAMMDYAKGQSDQNVCLINSDIELILNSDQVKSIEEKMDEMILMSNRLDYETDYTGTKYRAGIDVFFIHKKWLQFFPQSMHAMGMTFWDYWIPYTATQTFIPAVFIENVFAFHKKHAFQYSKDHWQKSGQFFLWEHRLYQFSDTNGIGNMSDHVFKFIYKACNKIKI